MVLASGSDEQYAQVALIALEGSQLVKSTGTLNKYIYSKVIWLL